MRRTQPSEVNPAGIITTIAGTGTTGSTSDNGPATSAELDAPYGVAEDIGGNVFIADFSAQVVREIFTITDEGLIILAVFGNVRLGRAGTTGTAAASAAFLGRGPTQVWFDLSGNLALHQRVRLEPDPQGHPDVAHRPGLLPHGPSVGGIVNYGDAELLRFCRAA